MNAELLERTVLHLRHRQAGGRLVPFAGLERGIPRQGNEIRSEHGLGEVTSGD